MALNSGDIAFVSFNADEDGWSIVTFVDIDPNTTIYFSDGTATSPTAIGTGESSFQWSTGANIITAGTVVRFSAIDSASRASSVGTFTVVNSSNIGLSATAETIYAFLGTSGTTPTTILTAVSSEATNTSLTTVGLTAGTNALKLTSSTDFAGYSGSRTGQASISNFKSLVFNPVNWTIDVGGDGTLVVPNITDFAIATGLPTVSLSASSSIGTEAGQTVITVTANTSSAVTGDQSVAVAVNGLGITTGDYTVSNNVITIANGATTGTVTFTVVDDVLAEGTETAILSINNPSSGIALGNTTSLNITITDNDVVVLPSVRIHDIQGAGHVSTYAGQSVTGVAGIVTAIAANGFYFQDPNPDANDATSEGIFVFTSSAPTVQVGDSLLVNGTVTEFRPGGSANNLTVTEIVSPVITKLSSGNALPAATILGNGGRAIPNQIISNDAASGNVENASTVFDPAQDGIDFYESLEGMLVQVNNPVATSPTAKFGTSEEIWVLADNGVNATSRTSKGGSLITSSDFNPERIQIDDLNNALVLPDVNVGAQLSSVTGVVNYDFNNYEVLVSTAPTVVQPSTLQKEVTNLTSSATQLTVATFNVENLDPSDTTFNEIASAIVANMKSPDIINLEEIQDNSGATNDGTVDANVTLQKLINAIASAGGPTYEYRQINPVNNQDGGEPGGNIRVAFLFNPNRVSFVEGSLQRLTDTNLADGDAFASSRKPLVGKFVFNQQEVTVIGNHFNSKGGDQPLFGPNQPPTLSSEVQRNQQATIVKDFVQGLLATNPKANIVVAGDLNDFEFSNPLTILESGGLNTLVETLPANERYTYNFQGNAQVLDQILASNNLSSKLDGFDVVHINSEFADQVSDHDPSVARFNLPSPNQASYTLQLLHYYGESGLLGVETAPIMGALIDKFDDQYSNTLVIGEGDSYIPGPWLVGGSDPSLNAVAGIGSTALGRPDIAIMNAFGTDVSALGNHEFDLGSPVLQSAIAASGTWAGAQFPLITSNLNFSADSSLRGLADSSLGGTATNAFAGKESSTIKGKIAPYTVITQGGEKIGIVGATTYDLLSKTSPNGTVPKDDGIPSTDDLQEVSAYIQSSVDALKALGINKIVMVDQLDTIDRNKALAPLVSGIDVMVAGGGHERLGDANDTAVGFNGHSANFVDTYPIVTAGSDGKPTLIVTTDTEYSYLGRLVVDFNANGEIILPNLNPAINGAYASTEANLQAAYGTTQTASQIVAGSTIGSQVNGITQAINNVIISKDSNIFGYTKVYLEGDRAFGRAQEVNLGDITADANLFKAKAALGNGAVLASLKNGGGIRASIGAIGEDGGKEPPAASSVKPAGAISQLDIENALRFDNKLMVFDTNPQGLLNILNYAAGLAPGNGGYAQIGGIRFSYDPTKAIGQRVQDVAIYDFDENLVAKIADNGVLLAGAPATISVAVLNFTANGGDGYPIKANADNFRYLLNDGTLSAPISKTLDFTALANVPANTLGEQQAFQDYLKEFYGTPDKAYAIADTPATQDQRIQNLTQKSDTVFQANLVPVYDLSAGNYSVLEGNTSSTFATVRVTRKGDLSSTSTVELQLTDGTATGGGVAPANSLITGLSSSQTPYVIPVAAGVTTKSILTVGDAIGGYKMAGIPDGLGTFDNGNGTFTLLMNQEIGNTLGVTRAHGNKGAFVSSWVINKSDLSVVSGSDLIQNVYTWNTATQSSNSIANNAANGNGIAFNRFCSADLPSVTAYYNATSGLGSQERIFMDGEEGGATGYQLATIATGAQKGDTYILGKFNLSTNGSGLTGVGAWENALANPFAQDKTIVIGNNDGGTGLMSNAIAVYVGTKTNTGTEIDKAGLTNGVLKFINVAGNAVEIVDANTRATNIASGTAFSLSGTASTTFSRPEDGAWNPLNPSQYFFVTTDRLDTVNDGIGTQVGRSRLWRLNFTDITNPDAGGTIDMLLDGSEGQTMFDNITIDKYGHILLLEDVGNAAHNGKVWQYDIATDSLKQLAKHDPARFGDVGIPATLPFNQDEETSGIIDAQDILGPGWFLLVDQAHYGISDELVEGGQLLALFNPDTYQSAVDYNNKPITVTFTLGETYKDIQVPIFGDTKPEGDETVKLNLANPSSGVIGTKQPNAVLTILNDDVNIAPVLTGTPAILLAGKEDTKYTIATANLLAGYTDANGDVLSVSGLTATNGTIVDNKNRTYSFTPNANFNGTVNLSYNVIDGNGGITPATQSFAITAVNDAPVGSVSISDTTPTETQTLVASNLFTDVDGLTNAVFNYQWQQSDVGGGATFTNISGAIGSTFTPTQAQVNRQLRVLVSYTDDQGTLETLTSAPTIVTGDFYVGTSSVNAFTGTNGQDIIAGLGNNDILNGLDGDDIFRYTIGDGKDTVDGGAGKDTLDIFGTNNSETLSVVFNGTPVSIIAGGSVTNVESVTVDLLGGIDTLNYGSTTADLTVNLNTGLATGFTAISNIENVTGGFGNDIITGDNGNNTLRGEFGNDILDGGLGADNLIGGAGNDTYIVDNINDNISDSSGIDTVRSSIGWTLGSNLENLTLTGNSDINGTGNGLQNVIVGNSGNNILNGGNNADNLSGGAGNDTYIVDNLNDVVNELANEGSDIILASVTRTLEANVENLTLTGNSTINGTGNDLNNIITGNSRNNILDGGVGADALIGGLGNDTYIVDNLGDAITEELNQGTDLVKSSVSWTLGENLENLTLTGIANINGTGNSVNNVITGNDGNNTLIGGFGNDSLTGGLGADILVGGFGNDNLFLGLNDGATDRVVYNLGDDSDSVNQFLRGVGGDLLQFNNIAAIDVRTVGGNTQFRLGDGVTGNGGFANGSLLLTLNGVTGFASSNINDNILIGSIPTTFHFS